MKRSKQRTCRILHSLLLELLHPALHSGSETEVIRARGQLQQNLGNVIVVRTEGMQENPMLQQLAKEKVVGQRYVAMADAVAGLVVGSAILQAALSTKEAQALQNLGVRHHVANKNNAVSHDVGDQMTHDVGDRAVKLHGASDIAVTPLLADDVMSAVRLHVASGSAVILHAKGVRIAVNPWKFLAERDHVVVTQVRILLLVRSKSVNHQ